MNKRNILERVQPGRKVFKKNKEKKKRKTPQNGNKLGQGWANYGSGVICDPPHRNK